jgi:small subunit ribosomal protein S19
MSRANWKVPFIQKPLLEKSLELKNNKKIKLKTWSRNSSIVNSLIGSQIDVHNGKNFIKLKILEGMLGHKLGEFVPTRAKFFYKKTKKK